MSKLFAIILLPIFLYNTTGFYFHFKWQTNILKKTIHTRYSDEDLVTLQNIPANQLSFIDEGKECLYKGEMYDIISVSQSDNYYTIVAYHDAHETVALEKLNKNVDDNLPVGKTSKDTQKQGIKSGIQTFINPTSEFTSDIDILVFYSRNDFSYNLLSGFPSLFSPPPQL